MSLPLLLLFLGVANWLATCVLVDSELFRDVREGAAKMAVRAISRAEETGTRFDVFRSWVAVKFSYLLSCQLCTGTWVGLIMALFVPSVVATPVVGVILTGLIIKGIGHLVLLLNNMGNGWIDRNKVPSHTDEITGYYRQPAYTPSEEYHPF